MQTPNPRKCCQRIEAYPRGFGLNSHFSRDLQARKDPEAAPVSGFG